MIDEDTRFMVASHLSNTRTFEDTVVSSERVLTKAKLDQEPYSLTVATFTRVHSTKYFTPCERIQELS